MTTERIPLFPLEVVLFPGAALPLHIFEPRYKEMMRLCLGEEREFGMVLQRPQGIAAIGCSALITELLKEYPDGRMDILALGQTRFHVENVIEEKSYYEVDVTFLVEDDECGALPMPQKLLAAYAEVHQMIFNQPPPPLESDEVLSLAYAMAGELPLDLDFKQLLLELSTENARRDALLERIVAWIPQVARQNHMKKVAGGNGHGLH